MSLEVDDLVLLNAAPGTAAGIDLAEKGATSRGQVLFCLGDFSVNLGLGVERGNCHGGMLWQKN
jgi:hypothetical protein